MKIFLKDDLKPEDAAMVQALYSRSPASVEDHLAKVDASGSGKFMDTFYVGYGHASIGDCGDTILFIEGVSMLAAKAIQDWPLYSGQEASTRYMDFSKTKIEDPIGTPTSADIQKTWMNFYFRSLEPVKAHVRGMYPIQRGEDERIYNKAVAARAFDIMRAFIPAGAHTNLSWKTNLRQAKDHLDWMLVHPDPTICEIASTVQGLLAAQYKNSGFDKESSEDVVKWRRGLMQHGYLLNSNVPLPRFMIDPERKPPEVVYQAKLSTQRLTQYAHLLKTRPRRAELPPFIEEVGTVTTEFLLDFGSFRDLQRHRNGVVRIPLLNDHKGFHPWYLNQLPEYIRLEAKDLIDSQLDDIRTLDADPAVMQHYYAMGFRVPCRVTQPLNAFIYRLELRTSKTVHPTLRAVVQEEARQFAEEFPDIALHVDLSLDDWDVRRGKQDIVEKS